MTDRDIKDLWLIIKDGLLDLLYLMNNEYAVIIHNCFINSLRQNDIRTVRNLYSDLKVIYNNSANFDDSDKYNFIYYNTYKLLKEYNFIENEDEKSFKENANRAIFNYKKKYGR